MHKVNLGTREVGPVAKVLSTYACQLKQFIDGVNVMKSEMAARSLLL